MVPIAPKMIERVSGASETENSSAHTSTGVLAKNGSIPNTHKNAYQKTNTTAMGASSPASRLSRPGSMRGTGTAPTSNAGDQGHRYRPSAPMARYPPVATMVDITAITQIRSVCRAPRALTVRIPKPRWAPVNSPTTAPRKAAGAAI